MGLKRESRPDTDIETDDCSKSGRDASTNTNQPRRKVQRHSPDRLLRRPVVLAGGVKVAAEKHRGRIVVRIDSPQVER